MPYCSMDQQTLLFDEMLFCVQAKREGVKKKEAQSGGRWFSGWFGRQATTEIETVGGLS